MRDGGGGGGNSKMSKVQRRASHSLAIL